MSRSNPIKYVAAGVAAVVLAFGAYALGNSNSSQGAAGAARASQQTGFATPNGQAPQSGQAPPGLGTPVSGATADKVRAAALAKYPGTIERIMQLPDGSYEAHVITSGGERHVTVSKAFVVTGSRQGGPGAGGPPAGADPQASGQGTGTAS